MSWCSIHHKGSAYLDQVFLAFDDGLDVKINLNGMLQPGMLGFSFRTSRVLYLLYSCGKHSTRSSYSVLGVGWWGTWGK